MASSVVQGQVITLVAQWAEYAGGPAVDVDGITITIKTADAVTTVLGPTSSGIVHAATGVYTYSWDTADDLDTGDYLAIWNATDAASAAVQTSELITVTESIPGSLWATGTQVHTYTGITVTSPQLSQAQFIVELFADVSSDASVAGNISQKNLRLLGQAVAYQAAWISQHPDTFTNIDVDDMSQDGVNFRNAHANSGVLAPLAKRAIDRLSWRRSRSLRLQHRTDALSGSTGSLDSAAADDSRPWVPMGGVR